MKFVHAVRNEKEGIDDEEVKQRECSWFLAERPRGRTTEGRERERETDTDTDTDTDTEREREIEPGIHGVQEFTV